MKKRYAHLNDGHGSITRRRKTVSEFSAARTRSPGCRAWPASERRRHSRRSSRLWRPRLRSRRPGRHERSGEGDAGLWAEAKTLQLHLAATRAAERQAALFHRGRSQPCLNPHGSRVHAQDAAPRTAFSLSGDIKQHESIEAGRIFAQMREAGMGGTTLSHIVRQRNSPELKAVVENLATGKTTQPSSSLKNRTEFTRSKTSTSATTRSPGICRTARARR